MSDGELVDASGPAAVVAGFEARARRYETACGEGAMAWRAWGQGPPLVLFHGAHGAWSHWIRNIDALASRRTVWACDLPGLGESAPPPDPHSGEGFAAVLAHGLNELFGPELPVDVVGFSFGGVLGAHLAANYPEVVRRLILVDTGGLAPPAEVTMHRVSGLRGEERREAQTRNLLALLISRRENVDEMALHLQAINPWRARVDAGPLVLPDKLSGVLPRVPVQVDAIWGELDQPHPVPAEQEAVLRRSHPDADFRVIPGVGHMSMYEGAEAFNATVLEMLDQPLRRP
jgi:pimeloyl-ACP methyl ester carboxylesterase